MTLKNILLIDKRVDDYETIVGATDPELCIPILFDYYTDTIDDIKARILTACCESEVAPTPTPTPTPTDNATQRCIGLLQHNYNRPFYNLVAGDTSSVILGVTDHDPDLATWAPLRDLITWCNTTPCIQTGYFDMMACALYSNLDWKYIIETLSAQTCVTIRASTDDTGAASLGGDWFLESHTGVNLKTVYFTEAIEDYRGNLMILATSVRGIYKTYHVKGVAKGSVITWGSQPEGGDSSSVSSSISSDVITIYSTSTAFAALKTNGSVIAWGAYNRDAGDTRSDASSLTTGVI